MAVDPVSEWWRYWMRWMTALVVLICLSILSCSQVLAHDDASWIASGHYYDNQGQHCCGPTDCRVATASDRIEGAATGIYVNGRLIEYRKPGIYQSIDNQTWICVHKAPSTFNQGKCLFRPARPDS